MNEVARREPDAIDIQSYDCGYASGYSEGVDAGYEIGYQACCKDQRMGIALVRKEKNYIQKQKISGWILIACSAVVTLISRDVTAAVLLVPLGLGLIFTKRRWMV